MAITYAQPTRFSCPACAKEVQAELCVVLDAAERPDLTVRALDGTLHDIQCPSCKATYRFDAPLLIYQSATEPHLLFSPAANEAGEESDLQARKDPEWLLDVLRRALGERWRDELIASGLPVVSRPMFVQALQPASLHPSVSPNANGPVILGVPDGVSEDDVFALLNPLDSASDADVDRAATAWRRVSQVSLDGFPTPLRIQILNHGAQAAWLRYKARHDTADLDLALTGCAACRRADPGRDPPSCRAPQQPDSGVHRQVRRDQRARRGAGGRSGGARGKPRWSPTTRRNTLATSAILRRPRAIWEERC